MKILRKKKFAKNYEKLSAKQQNKVDQALMTFSFDPFDSVLENHALKGKYLGQRSISAGGDLRIIFQEKNDYVEVLLIRVGTHSQLY